MPPFWDWFPMALAAALAWVAIFIVAKYGSED